MIAIDTNVLVYAHRAELAEHEASMRWVRHFAEGQALFAVPVFCVGEFLRVVTHPRVFSPPSTRAQAWQFLEAVLGSPSARLIGPGDHFVERLRRTLEDGDATGNLVFDAQIAAVLGEHGVSRIVTADRDMRRFDLVSIDPLRVAPMAPSEP